MASASIYTLRSASAAPSGAGSYDNMIKFVMRRRTLRVLVLSAVFTWACTSLLAFSPRNGLFSEIIANFTPGHLVLVAFASILGVLPSFILLRLSLRGEYTTPGSAFAFSSPSAFGAFVAIYAAQGFALAFIYAVNAGVREWDDPRLSVFAPSARHRFLLNERWVLLTLSNAVIAAAFAVRTRTKARTVDAWPSFTTRPPHRPNFIPALIAATPKALTFATEMSLAFFVSYYLFHLWISRSILFWLPFLRPYMGSFALAKYSPTSLGMMLRCLSVNVLSVSVWEFVRILLQTYSTEPIVMSSLTTNPNATLISGLTSSDAYIQHHAFHELSVVAQTVSPEGTTRRKALLSDLKSSHPAGHVPSNSVPYATSGAWAVLLRQSLLVLGRDYQVLLGRGTAVPRPTPPAPASTPTKDAGDAKPAKGSINVRPGGASILRPAPPTSSSLASSTTRSRIMDSFGSDGAATNVLGGLVESASQTASAIPSIFLGEGASVSPSSSTGALVKKASGSMDKASGTLVALRDLAKAPVQAREKAGKYLEGLEKAVMGALPALVRNRISDIRWKRSGSSVEQVKNVLRGRKMDLWIVESLSYLTAFSLNEDAYGVVQRDVPRVLEALLSFTSALEAYAAEVEKRTVDAHASGADEGPGEMKEVKAYLEKRKLAESEAVAEIIGPLLTALRSGVKLIVGAFGDRLEVFKFSPETAARLQAVVDTM